jgi:tRNA(adenine34) deaminase
MLSQRTRLNVGFFVPEIRYNQIMNIMSDDLHYMQQALELAREAQTNNEVPIGAILVLNNEIIATAFNQPISECDPTAHAEILALRAGAKKLDNYRLLNTTLYVTLEPCAMCAAALVHARIKRLVFAAADPKAGAVTSHFNLLDSSILNHSVMWEQGLLADEAGELLKRFFKVRR